MQWIVVKLLPLWRKKVPQNDNGGQSSRKGNLPARCEQMEERDCVRRDARALRDIGDMWTEVEQSESSRQSDASGYTEYFSAPPRNVCVCVGVGCGGCACGGVVHTCSVCMWVCLSGCHLVCVI